MDDKLYNYIKTKIEELEREGVSIPEGIIEKIYNSLSKETCSLEEKIKRVDYLYQNVLDNNKRKMLDEKVKKGEYSNFDEIKEVINKIVHSELAPYISIYGSNVPYLLSGENPKRVIGDVDMVANAEDMTKVREIIKNNPNIFKVIIDSTDYTDDYGMELQVNGIDVSIFTHEHTNEGRIVRNFTENILANSIDTKSILFPGIYDEETTVDFNIDGVNIKLECPEYVYIQKSAAKREKDKIDMKVLERIVDKEKLENIKNNSKIPKVLESSSVILNQDLKQIKNNY